MNDTFRTFGIYVKCIKPIIDFLLALLFVMLFWWVYILVAVFVKVKLGSPVIYTQDRVGKKDKKTGNERIFKLYKFRSMSNEKDETGNLLPDEQRLTSFGRLLRQSSLDELPEIFFNILVFRNMSWVGPRPLLVEYLPWYTTEERHRHDVKPGLTGLAQISGRNYIGWDKRLNFDCEYVNNVSIINDTKILIKTVIKVFGKSEVAADTSKVETNLAEERARINYDSGIYTK